MKTVRLTSQFKKDIKRMGKRRKDFTGFKEIVEFLISGQIVDDKYRDHSLIGQYKGTRECHIEPDWLLIYESSEDEIVLIRKGSHSDLFKLRENTCGFNINPHSAPKKSEKREYRVILRGGPSDTI